MCIHAYKILQYTNRFLRKMEKNYQFPKLKHADTDASIFPLGFLPPACFGTEPLEGKWYRFSTSRCHSCLSPNQHADTHFMHNHAVTIQVELRAFSLNIKEQNLPFSALTLLVGWQEGHPACKKLSGGMLAWLSVWNEVQTYIWPSWCQCHSLSLASVKSRSVFPFWSLLTRVVPVCVWVGWGYFFERIRRDFVQAVLCGQL